jgi:hypothetical protein
MQATAWSGALELQQSNKLTWKIENNGGKGIIII